MSRIDDIRMVDPVLTTIAQGYSNNSMITEHLLPIVSVSKLKGKIPIFGKEAFIVREMNRAMRAQSNRIPPSDMVFETFETTEKDIELAIDYIEEEESPDFARYEQRLTKQLVDIMLLDREKTVVDYVQNPLNFEADLLEEIDENSAFDDYSLNIDPLSIIRDAQTSIKNKISRYPNTMVIGDSAYNSLINHPKLIERVKYSGLTNVSKSVLSEMLDIKDIHIGLAVHSLDGSAFSDVWSDNIILAFVDRHESGSRSEYNPSYGYIFRREGKPEIDTYYENGGKIKVIRNTDNYCMKITAPDAAFLIHHTNHN